MVEELLTGHQDVALLPYTASLYIMILTYCERDYDLKIAM